MSRPLIAAWSISAMAVAAGCSAITSAYDFQIDADAGTDDRLCAVCKRADLRRPPCPPGGEGAPGAGTYVFAAKSVSFGAGGSAATPPDLAAAAGLDQDCSDRPVCTPPPGTLVPSAAQGVDDAFASLVVAPITTGHALDPLPMPDLDQTIDRWIGAGQGGLLVVVGDWNGAPDDAAVSVRVLEAQGPAAGGAPSFAADEPWIAFADGWDDSGHTLPHTTATASEAYVAGGVLVADLRTTGAVVVSMGSTSGARGELRLFEVVLAGAIAPSGMTHLALAGELQSGGQRGFGFERQLAQLAVGCAPADFCKATPIVQSLLDRAFDLPGPTTPNGATCSSTSVGLAIDAPRVGPIASVVPRASALVSCPGADTFCPAP